MPKIHYWHLHGSLCRAKVPEIGLTKYMGFVTCKNCLWLMAPLMDRLKAGEAAVAKTYIRHVMLVKREIWEFRYDGRTKVWPTINQIADALGISPVRVFDICDTEQNIKMDKISNSKGILFEETRARL